MASEVGIHWCLHGKLKEKPRTGVLAMSHRALSFSDLHSVTGRKSRV